MYENFQKYLCIQVLVSKAIVFLCCVSACMSACMSAWLCACLPVYVPVCLQIIDVLIMDSVSGSENIFHDLLYVKAHSSICGNCYNKQISNLEHSTLSHIL